MPKSADTTKRRAGPSADPRMAGLPEEHVQRLFGAARAIRDGQFAAAEQALGAVRARFPEHPEALRLTGILLNRQQRFVEARAVLERALAQQPEDAPTLSDLASALNGTGETEAALEAWRRATRLAPESAVIWFNLGRNLQLQGSTEEAAQALAQSVALEPRLLPARILLGDALVHLGRFDQADACYREVLRQHPSSGDAWRGLSNIKTRRLTDADLALLEQLVSRPEIPLEDRMAMGFALGKALEERGRYPDAFQAISEANANARQIARWDSGRFRAQLEEIREACAALARPPENPELGSEVLFIVGMPRSGSTLVEQILAAHPEVEGASELPDLDEVLREESLRRAAPFPRWIPDATEADWTRLGERYLAQTARWRRRRPRSTDKMPQNWIYAGVLAAMLPGARIIHTWRDPVETGWSCFKQNFFQLPNFSCDLDDIAAYLLDCDRVMSRWEQERPERIRTQHYEALLSDPEPQIRALLAFCGLAFDEACLRFHESARSVRTASAAQVRQPIRRDTARAHHYGVLLDPLRRGLRPLMRDPLG